MPTELKPPAVLFVCLGNICRSPTAHGVFRHMLSERGLTGRIHIDSAGTGDWHLGNPPDKRACAVAHSRGYAIDDLRARRVCPDDFYRFDYLLAMDRNNLRDLERMRPDDAHLRIELFLNYASDSKLREVPDPYHKQDSGFQDVLSVIEDASRGLLQALLQKHPSLDTG